MGLMHKTILITGINGFLGYNLALKLKDYYNIIGIDINISKYNNIDYNTYQLPIDKADQVFMENHIDLIVHTATLFGGKSRDFIPICENNIINPLKLVNTATYYGCSKFINIDTVLDRFSGLYALSKRHFQEWLYSLIDIIKVVNVQIEYMYGENAPSRNLITWLIKCFLNNEKYINMTSGEQIRNFIHIDDVCNALFEIINLSLTTEDHFINYHLTSNDNISIKELAITLKEMCNNELTDIKFGAIKKNNANDDICVIKTNLEKIPFWEPKVNLNEGLRNLINFYKERGIN